MGMQINRENLAWAAGFMDGEAHFGLVTTNNKTKNKHIHIQVCQTEDGPLERLQRILGGGKIYGPYTPKKSNTNRKPYKQFHIDKFENVQHAVCLVWNWLSGPKKEQIKLMLHEYAEYSIRPRVRRGPAPKPPKIPSCHPERAYKAKGKCNSCYRTELRRTNVN